MTIRNIKISSEMFEDELNIFSEKLGLSLGKKSNIIKLRPFPEKTDLGFSWTFVLTNLGFVSLLCSGNIVSTRSQLRNGN